MSTKIPWFRYGFRETKKWLSELVRKKDPCISEVRDALDRCLRKDKIFENLRSLEDREIIWRSKEEHEDIMKFSNPPETHCPDCGSLDYRCAGNDYWPCLEYRNGVLAKLSKEKVSEIKSIENNDKLFKRTKNKLIDEIILENIVRCK